MLYLLLIICGVNQFQISNLMAVLYSVCFHYRSLASLVLPLPVHLVIRATIGIGLKRVRPSNGLIVLVFQ